jgi:glycine hydroxymethyltransferase
LLQREDARQDSTIILIASESASPEAVREAMRSNFGNIYAEGYPREESRRQTQAEILDMDMELAHYRRYSDPRYYKGVEYADVLEALTRRRAAELFAANGISADNCSSTSSRSAARRPTAPSTPPCCNPATPSWG